MTKAEIASCVRQAFDAGWLALGNGIPHYFAGQTIPITELEDQTWVRLKVDLGDSEQVSMGGGATGKRVRTVGVAAVSIFKPTGEGHGELFRLSDSIASIWQVSTIQGIVYRATSVQSIQTDGPWEIQPVFTPFYADDFVT